MDTVRHVGIMGGTFNPIHHMHLMLAESAYRMYHLDEVIFIPAGDPPHKTDLSIAPAHDRTEMVMAAIAPVDYFSISYMEIQRNGRSYSADTLEILHKQHPDTVYYFIMGADSIFQIESWYHPEKIMKQCIILAGVRNHVSAADMEEQIERLEWRYQADIRLLDAPDVDISSSMLRQRVYNGQSIRYMVPDTVDAYIQEHGLYLQLS